MECLLSIVVAIMRVFRIIFFECGTLKFFSTRSLNIEDLKRRLRAVEADDLVRGPTGSVFLWKMPSCLGVFKLSIKEGSIWRTDSWVGFSLGKWLEKAVTGRGAEVGFDSWGAGRLASGFSHLMYVLESKLVIALIPLYSMAAISYARAASSWVPTIGGNRSHNVASFSCY